MQAVILAAGRGTRLQPLTDTTPKPMLKVGGKPILEHIIFSLPNQIDEVLIVVEYLREQIENHFGDSFYGKKIRYVTQSKIKGTYGAIFSAKQYLTPGKFLTIGGDDLHNKKELSELVKIKRALGFSYKPTPSKNFLVLEYNDEKYLTGARRAQENEGIIPIATGAYVLDEHLWNYPMVNVGGEEYGLPQSILLMNKDFPVTICEQKSWFQINTSIDLKKANDLFS